jgi:hypothetical protein
MFTINFLLGGAIGSAATYVYKDEKAREWVANAKANIQSGSQSFMSAFRKKSGQVVTDTTAQTAETASQAKEKQE